MKSNLKEYLKALFYGEPRTPANDALLEELYGNLCDRYDELIAQGSTPDEAYARAIDELGDISPLIERDQRAGGGVSGTEASQKGRRKSKQYLPPVTLRRTKRNKALCLAAAVMLYILWLVPCVLFDAIVPLFAFVAFGTSILLLSNRWNPDFIDDSALSYDEVTLERDRRVADLLLSFGVGICILSVLPAAIIDSDLGAALLFVFVAVGVGMILLANGIRPRVEKGIGQRFETPGEAEPPRITEAPKKRRNPWLLPVTLIAVVAVLWSSVWMAIRYDFEFGIWVDKDDFRSYDRVGDAIVSEAVDNITVYWNMGEVTVTSYEGDQIRIRETYTGSDELSEDDLVHWGVKDGRLSVRYNKHDMIHFRLEKYPEKKLEILIPQASSVSTQNVERITIETVSASVHVDTDFTAALAISTASGTVTVRNGTGNTEIETVSGDITIMRRSMDTLKLETVTGNTSCHKVIIEELDFESVSGGLLFKAESKIAGADLETVSGNITLESDTAYMTGGLRCETVSGDLVLVITKHWYGFDATLDTVSGRFISETVPVTQSDGRYHYGREEGVTQIDFSSTSGNLIVDSAE